MGGIRTGLDALQFILAGASAVSVGTAVFGDPVGADADHAELDQALDERGFASLRDAIGLAHCRAAERGPPRAGGGPMTAPFGARLWQRNDAAWCHYVSGLIRTLAFYRHGD